MEQMDEETKGQESSCRGLGRVGGSSAAKPSSGQTGKMAARTVWSKPQEENCRPAQRATPAARSPEKLIEIVIASICAWFGD